jgi:hypothetical protein
MNPPLLPADTTEAILVDIAELVARRDLGLLDGQFGGAGGEGLEGNQDERVGVPRREAPVQKNGIWRIETGYRTDN